MKFRKLLTTVVSTMCAAVLALSMVSCGNNKSGSSADTKADSSSKVEVDESKSFTIAFYPEYAPDSCAAIESLVKQGFYDGLIFHRVLPGFMAQCGAFTANNTIRTTGTKVNGEFSANGYTKNTLKHERGTVSMCRSSGYNSASSQFFICYSADYPSLNGNYAAFGKVTSGMEVIDQFTTIERTLGTDNSQSKPVTPITILKAEMIEDDSDGHHQAKFYMSF